MRLLLLLLVVGIAGLATGCAQSCCGTSIFDQGSCCPQPCCPPPSASPCCPPATLPSPLRVTGTAAPEPVATPSAPAAR
jgi:hypothetical protein